MRRFLLHFDLPQPLWVEARMTETYCVNVVPNTVRGMEIPYSVWYGETPAYARLHIFGCAALTYVDKVERRKLDAKAKEAIFVGYSREKRGYRFLDSMTTTATTAFYEEARSSPEFR
ncbi:hypothetical protein PHMEG_00019777 [Phytophthora megakarya]|uniref:Retroviral polymerase SH3-like domain-containing protein n=1 Tax=Phytophthora megakarya TaxID=4795 RepID=A0A225VTD8_9STRA|nr:hypothetical protein PHMEG_00019777 [Phytophthora megakarya]